MQAGKNLNLNVTEQQEPTLTFLKALASEPRLAILAFLDDRVVNINEIADALGMSPSSATSHIQILEKAGLIRTEIKPASHGLQKLCARTFDHIVIHLPRISGGSRLPNSPMFHGPVIYIAKYPSANG